MALYEVRWSAQGTSTVEADDPDEAEQLVTEGLQYFDTSQFEQFDVDETEMLETKNTAEKDDDDDD